MNRNFHLYLNREALPETVAPGGVIEGVQISPVGDWPNGEAIQHVNRSAIDAMISAWINGGRKEILCDFEHNAEHGGSTMAAAWIANLRYDEARGFVGDFRFTDVGAEAVSARRLRFLSPCWACNVDRWTKGGDAPADDDTPAEVTPATLVSVALTNKPNIPVAPVLNRAPTGIETVGQKDTPNMDKIKEALGLPPEATEEDILAAIGTMKAENEECCKEREERARADAEKEADAFAEANAKKCNREVIKRQYLANKEATIALVNAIHEQAVATVVNKAEAKTPTFENRTDADEKVLTEYENMAAGKAKDEFLMANAVTINRARNARAAAK